MNELINLRYLYAEGCTLSLIHKIGQLTNLQELEEFHVSEKNQIVELGNLKKLGGQLCIANLEKVSLKDVAHKAELCRKTNLKTLELKWNNSIDPTSSDSDNCRTILEALEPPRELKELKIQGYRGSTFPKWAETNQDFKCLESIHISHCKNLGCLPPLGLIPNLKFLLLADLPSIEKIDDAFYGNYGTAFQSLEEITFQRMSACDGWSALERRKSMPQLKKVTIESCPKLKEAPLHCFRETLLELVLSDCGSILMGEGCLHGFRKLKHLRVCKYSGAINLSCPSLTSLSVLNVSNDGSKIDLGGGTEQLQNLRCLVINGEVLPSNKIKW
ncbi:disease resistance protein RGA2-like [Oryza brachyantha]|uniref:disease resistance protein RGA2-like n=1 Tax=Oryza brachyantha TaxID=4533 RepID=UPI0007762698|nr:disease resistance protein RGA2-like [Oryza brachyantha]